MALASSAITNDLLATTRNPRLHNGADFLWLSERDGWRHAYLVSRDGKRVQLITHGNFDVTGLPSADEKSGWLYFDASPDNATQRNGPRPSQKSGRMYAGTNPGKS